jgi:hypothetical protein
MERSANIDLGFVLFGGHMDRAARLKASMELEQCRGDLIGHWYGGANRQGSFLEKRLYQEEPPMDHERKSSNAGQRAAEGLREAAAKEEAKNESKMGHDLAKGADRFEERSKSSDGKTAEEKQKG